MYNFSFYNFTKRAASTKRPAAGDASDTYAVVLKEPSDLVNPTIEVKTINAFPYNYAHCAELNRYYWVDKVRAIAYDTYEVDLKGDVLASWVSSVIGQDVYAMYSEMYYDTELDDDRVQPTNELTFERAYGDFDIVSGGASDLEIPCYQFLSVVNNNGLLNGIDVFFGLSTISDYLKNVADRNWAQQLAQDAGNVNPFDAINEAWWTPLIPQQCHRVSTNSAQIYDVAISASCLASPYVKGHKATITLPRPSVSDFRFSNKFVKYYLAIPYMGIITIPTDLVHGTTVLEYAYSGDCLTGQMCFAPRINGVSLGQFGTSLKAPITLARQSSQVAQIVTSGGGAAAIAGGAGAKLGGGVGAVAGAAGGFMGGVIKGIIQMPDIERVGSSVGSIAPVGCRSVIGSPMVTMVESESNVEPSNFTEVAGRPTQRIVSLMENCGFIQTVNANVEFAGTLEEVEAFNSLLDSGVYFE